MNTSPTDSPNLDAEVSRVQRRTLQYWFEDGLVELAIGSSFLLLSSWIATMSLLPTSVAGKLGAGFPVAYILIFLACRRVIRRAKEGLVYPRTGYVSYARPSPRRRLLSQLAGAIVAALVVLLVRKAPPIEAGLTLLELHQTVMAGRPMMLSPSAPCTSRVQHFRGTRWQRWS